jgi:hypothetical protein
MYRSRKLTYDVPRLLTNCVYCNRWAPGGIVAAHSNQQRDGKGTGIKAHDYRIAYLCPECHYEVDQGGKSYDEKIAMWEEAHRLSIAFLFDNGHIK